MKSIMPLIAVVLFTAPVAAGAQSIQPGNWDVTSKAIELVVPGTASFMLKMMLGKSKTEHQCVSPEQAKTGIAAVLAPDPKAQCRVESLRVSGNRFEQLVSCPNKQGGTMKIVRAGVHSAEGFTARMTMTGQNAKGASRVVLDQVAVRAGGACRR